MQLGCQTYATCFATCNEIIFYARRVFRNVSGILIICRIVIGSFSKNCETICSGGVTRCNLSRSIAKSRSCFYFLCNLQRNFSLRDYSCKHGVSHEEVFLVTCNATPLRCKLKRKLPHVTWPLPYWNKFDLSSILIIYRMVYIFLSFLITLVASRYHPVYGLKRTATEIYFYVSLGWPPEMAVR